MTAIQLQARALGDPTRHRIFEYLCDAAGPVGVAELTELCGLHHNAVRQHLATLVDAGLVAHATPLAGGRGRPRLQFVVDPSADSRWGVTGPYEKLAMLLTEVVRTGDTPVEVGRRAGARQRLGAGAGVAEPVTWLTRQMAEQGFEPSVRTTGDRVDMTLQVCPFVSAVLTDADTVCQIHLGIAQGLAEAVGGIEVEELEPHDPRRAHCHLRCRTTASAPGADPAG